MTFFKSISLAEDLSVPLRAAHYRPTAKSMGILHAVLGMDGSTATSIVATYGSGKSLGAVVAGLLVEAEPGKLEAMEPARSRLLAFDKSIGTWMRERTERGGRGRVITLAGYVPHLPFALCGAIGIAGVETIEEACLVLEKHLRATGADRLAIVWDEFGRHLETLAGRGRAEELAALQDLAEWTTRRKSPPATLTLLLHQDFHRYAGRLGQTDQSGWRKIEGRFDVLRIVEDSDEIYELVADVAQDLTRKGKPRVPDGMVKVADELGLFPFAHGDALGDLLRRAAPLSPTALYLLPRIAGRIGQGERTVFGFLGTELPEDRSALVTVEDLYRHFSDGMRADTAVGGTHKRFVETEAARTHASTPLEREVIAAASLLHLAATGDTARITRHRLEAALDLGSTHPRRAIEEAVDGLLARKLLLHRTLTDEISVWEGSDVDVRSRAQEQVNTLRTAGDPLDRVRAHVPAPHFVGEAYNHEHAITRYAQGVLVTADDLRDETRRSALLARADAEDALVALIIDASIQDAEALCGPWMEGRPHFVIALAAQNPDLNRSALEADAYAHLERDELLLEMDPRVGREIAELKGDVVDFLTRRAATLTDPAVGAVTWFAEGRSLGSGHDLRPGTVMSAIFEARFPFTPRFANEQIVRRRVTAQTKSARKRLLLGILERSSVPYLGYQEQTTSDASLFRTTLSTPGLFDAAGARWITPDEIDHDLGLRLVWEKLEHFFGVSSAHPRSFEDIVSSLSQPPIGLRAGIIPILLTAGLRAFGHFIAVRRNIDGRWRYIDDLVPSVMEDIAHNPAAYEIEVLKISKPELDRIERLISQFSAVPDRVETDLVRAFYDAIEQWKRALPRAAMTAKGLGEEAVALQGALRQTSGDPVDLLLRAFPSIAGRKRLDEETVSFVTEGRKQIERITDRYVDEAIRSAQIAFGGDGSGVLESAQAWGQLIPSALLRAGALDGVSRAVLRRARAAASGRDTERSFARALSAILLGLDFEEWDDTAARDFGGALKARLREIEDAVVSSDELDAEAAPFLRERICAYIEILRRTAGDDAVAQMMIELRNDRR